MIKYRGRRWKDIQISQTSFVTLIETSANNLSYFPKTKCFFYYINLKSLIALLFLSIFFLQNFILFTFSVLPSEGTIKNLAKGAVPLGVMPVTIGPFPVQIQGHRGCLRVAISLLVKMSYSVLPLRMWKHLCVCRYLCIHAEKSLYDRSLGRSEKSWINTLKMQKKFHNFWPCLIFVGKTRRLPWEWSSVRHGASSANRTKLGQVFNTRIGCC